MNSSPEVEHVSETSGGVPLRGFSDFSSPIPKFPFWLKLVPFFLSAALFLSAFLAVFSPLPILLAGMMGLSPRKSNPIQRGWAILACLTNGLLVFGLAGSVSLATYFVFVIFSSLTLLEFLARRKRLEVAAGASLLSMAVASGLVVLFFSLTYHIHAWSEIRNAVSQFVDYWVKTAAKSGGQAPVTDPAKIDEWKRNLMVELPSAVAVVGLVMVWSNLLLVLRLNPRNVRSRLGIRPDFFQNWKSPEWLIWPTLVAGATLLGNFGTVTDVGRNFFKFLMAIYAIQGLSILSFFFNVWRVNRAIRLVGYLLAVMVLMPLLLSLGFFDLWFDFRSKFRQS